MVILNKPMSHVVEDGLHPIVIVDMEIMVVITTIGMAMAMVVMVDMEDMVDMADLAEVDMEMDMEEEDMVDMVVTVEDTMTIPMVVVRVSQHYFETIPNKKNFSFVCFPFPTMKIRDDMLVSPFPFLLVWLMYLHLGYGRRGMGGYARSYYDDSWY
jgi:hypothetical protein